MSRFKQGNMQFRKKLPISSLEAAICNVALFKNMKEKEFKEEIYISYCEQGVFLEAVSEQEWNDACSYTEHFLKSKRIALLAYGFERQAYEELIIKGLKEYTRRIKDKGQECPYINIIHYQKLRKSCQYMDKEKYVEPLKDWEKKSKTNPNFAFLIVEPHSMFEEVKRNLLQYLLNKPVPLQIGYLSPAEFIYTFFNSPLKESIKEAFTRKYIEVSYCQDDSEQKIGESRVIRVANYTDVDIEQYEIAVTKSHKNISKLGVQFISSKDIRSQIVNVKHFVREAKGLVLFQKMQEQLRREYGENYALIPYRRGQKEKCMQLIQKLTNMNFSKEELVSNLRRYIVCDYEDMEFLSVVETNSKYSIHKVAINNCPFMTHEYSSVRNEDLDAFVIYLDQLSHYYNNYMVRFYGICANPDKPSSYSLIFDSHHRTLAQMLSHDQILDNCAVGTIILQILYLIRFLHSHEEPRCIGKLALDQIYWPMCLVLPYLSEDQENSVEGDVRLAGLLIKQMLGQDADEFQQIISLMLKESKYDRITLAKCISTFQQILALN